MPRIPEEVIERIKREVSVLRQAEAMGCKIERKGPDNYACRCRWHKDDSASLMISVKKNVFHCLSCGAGGSPIDWAMLQYGVSFPHAAKLLEEGLTPSAGAASQQPVKQSSVRHLPPPIERDADDREAMLRIIDYYHETLKSSPDALGYLEKRGLASMEAIEHFKLGYADRTLGYRLPDKNRKLGDELRSQLTRLGIYRDSGHEHFNGSLVVPIFAEDGSVTEIYGRKVTRDTKLRKGTPLHLYLPGPHQGVWNLEAIRASKEVIVCEALLDALTFWCHGYRNVTASYGVQGFTCEHLEAFQRFGTERVLIAYDRDEAGDQAAKTLAEKLATEGIECYRVEFPHGMDANEFALKVTPAAKSLGLVLRKASWLGNGRPPASRQILSARAPADLSLILEAAAKSEDLSPLAADARVGETGAAEDLAAVEPTEAVAAAPLSDADPTPNLARDGGVSEANLAPETGSTAAIEASPLPPPPPPSPPIEVAGDEVRTVLGDRLYRVRGVPPTPSAEHLAVLLLLELHHPGDVERVRFADRLDLFIAKSRDGYAKQAERELGIDAAIVRRDLGVLLGRLEQYQHEEQERERAAAVKEPEMTDDERREALDLLRDPKLLDRILQDFERCGVVGEETNKLMGYLATVSRKLKDPLAVIIQSSSAAGKSSLMEAMLAFVPPEDREKFSAMTGQALFYAEDLKLKHKILAIVEEEGAERASYALKLLQSEKELTIASAGKDPKTGEFKSRTYHVEGPTMILLTTTAIDVDEELLNRCIVLSVDEDREQTRAIHRLQRLSVTLRGQRRDAERDNVLRVHRNAQRLLRPLRAIVEQAERLTFPDTCTRTRRDHRKYLTLIQSVAYLKQYQHEVLYDAQSDFDYVEATIDDIATANRLANEVLGRSLDELAPQTRKLLLKLDGLVVELAKTSGKNRDEIRFSRRQVREATGWRLTQVKVHLDRLVEYEYVVVRGGRGGQTYEYELLYDGQGKDGSSFLIGLIDVKELEQSQVYDGNLSASNGHLSDQTTNLSGLDRAQIAPRSGRDRISEIATFPRPDDEFLAEPPKSPENADPRPEQPEPCRTDTPYAQRKERKVS